MGDGEGDPLRSRQSSLPQATRRRALARRLHAQWAAAGGQPLCNGRERWGWRELGLVLSACA